MTSADDLAHVEFIYDAIRKVGVAQGTDAADGRWRLEFVARHADDSMSVVISPPGRESQEVTLVEDDFQFTDNTVTLNGVVGATFFMNPIYVKKLRGFTRGNIPTPDIAGPTLP